VDGRPLLSLSEDYGVVVAMPEWPVVIIGDEEPRHVPPKVAAAGRYVRHVLWYRPGDIQFWYMVSQDGENWRYAARTDV
jgi:hypothetical protein